MIPRSTAASICFSVLVAATRVREASLSDVADATDALALQKLIDELGGSLKYKQAESRQMLPINIPMTDQEKRTALARTGTADNADVWVADGKRWCDTPPATFECTVPLPPRATYITEQDAMGGMNAVLRMAPCVVPRINETRQQVREQQPPPPPGQRKEPGRGRQRYVHTAAADPCASLKAAGVSNILFTGDSYVRMAYQAMGMWLSNNYRNASVDPTASPQVAKKQCQTCVKHCHAVFLPEICDFDGAFRDNECRPYILPKMNVCSGAVTLHMRQSYFPAGRPTTPDFDKYDLIVWGMGNHPPDNSNYTTHYGTNNAEEYKKAVLEPVCKCGPFTSAIPDLNTRGKVVRMVQTWGNEDCVDMQCWNPETQCKPWDPTMAKKVLWLHPHFRPVEGKHPTESRNVTDLYAEEMPKHLHSTCGLHADNIVNPYHFTKSLVRHHLAVIERLGYTHEAQRLSPNDKTSLYCRPTLGNEPANMCWSMHTDPSHWGMAINLIKAHAIMSAIEDVFLK